MAIPVYLLQSGERYKLVFTSTNDSNSKQSLDIIIRISVFYNSLQLNYSYDKYTILCTVKYVHVKMATFIRTAWVSHSSQSVPYTAALTP